MKGKRKVIELLEKDTKKIYYLFTENQNELTEWLKGKKKKKKKKT
jgi:hypothetical protein